MGWWQVARGHYHWSAAVTHSDSVFLPFPVFVPLTHTMEPAGAKGLAGLQHPQSTPYMGAWRLQRQVTAGPQAAVPLGLQMVTSQPPTPLDC